jgi:glyoxylase-like metal-dependent hydrolase (beta-lactamase superfamily II)
MHSVSSAGPTLAAVKAVGKRVRAILVTHNHSWRKDN